ncbi:hypothetical protein V1L54_07080 [Streptomyces sp. TRM 70361]|uniref:hypothetical protein n=1 Tax=Streptomyces sp. TRM 70361 TaxID=3116553 RepID=UPI002E7AC0AB|nr:hypothetical protein [Streptomyces sp. TRM 70361]MEE1939175.1 hypothetical protein [Streptomyces sp. TRM 70361]
MNRPPDPYRSADPVHRLLDRHRGLCERAVDPLEIAAGLEAHGITDRTAARFRHRSVFSLAEELYARAPRAGGLPPGPVPAAPDGGRETGRRRPAGRAGAVLLPLLPGGLCAAAVHLPVPAGTAPAVAVAAVAGAVLWAVGRHTRSVLLFAAVVLGSCWLLGYALVGDRLLARALDGGTPPRALLAELPAAPAAERCLPLGLALSVAPAVWCARRFAARTRLRLAAGRGLAEFAARTRPPLALAVALSAAAPLAALSAARLAVGGGGTGAGAEGTDVPGLLAALRSGTVPALLPELSPDGPPGAVPLAAVAALGALLFTAGLLAAHGFPAVAAAGLAAAAGLEAAALAVATGVPAARWPALAPLGRPVAEAAARWGPAAVPAVACAGAALFLTALAAVLLTRASAHRRDGP